MERSKKKKIGLTTWIFFALLTGAVTGLAIHYGMPEGHIKNDILMNGIFYVVGQGFLRLMQMLVVPLVFCSIVCGAAAIGDTKTLGKVGVKTLCFYLATTALAISVALATGRVISPGKGLDMAHVITQEVGETMAKTSLADTLLNVIPKNPIGALANGEMLQIIIFAMIVGIILAKLSEKTETVLNFLQQGNDIMMEMTMMVMRLAPFGVPDCQDIYPDWI